MLGQITGTIAGALDFVLSPLTLFSPVVSLFLISFMLTAIILFLKRLVMDKEIVKEIKDEIQETREKLTKAQKEGNKDVIDKSLHELMKLNSKYMKQTSKTLVVSIIVIALFLPWLRYKYSGAAVATLPFSLPFIGSKLSWVMWYILVSFTIGWLIRKLFGFE